MKLIVGLGNPGREYAKNRHNLGFRCLSLFARERGIHFDKKQGLARTGAGEIAGVKVLLARPQTYMNLSGESVSRLQKKFRIDRADLLVIHDDLDLPPGKIRIRQDGGSGGHKGIASITAALGSPDFIRLRVGIGRPADVDEETITGYVLSDFTPEEENIMTGVIPTVSEAILCLLSDGLEAAMNKYNRVL
ncbi:MAG: aminoacyl-tRNA hydrolase [Chloroflexota bacterium]